jgi:hypothetical protein
MSIEITNEQQAESRIKLNGHAELANVPDGTLASIEVRNEITQFTGQQALEAMKEWIKKLKVGGELLVSVPDFDRCVDAYRNGTAADVEFRLIGAQGEHKSIWNRGKVQELLRQSGLDEIGSWACGPDDMWLGMRGSKVEPITELQNVEGLISMPRLAWTENMFCSIGACLPLKINLTKHTGAFWGQCLSRLMTEAIAKPAIEWVLTIDYDSIFSREDIVSLYRLAKKRNLDAVAAMQVGRERQTVLITCSDDAGNPRTSLTLEEIESDAIEVATAHFGLTLIRADALRNLPRPWFHGQPAPDGTWGEGRVDDDIQFWKQWKRSGYRVWQANRVRIGHMQVVVSWPDRTLSARHQYHSEFINHGKPDWAR